MDTPEFLQQLMAYLEGLWDVTPYDEEGKAYIVDVNEQTAFLVTAEPYESMAEMLEEEDDSSDDDNG